MSTAGYEMVVGLEVHVQLKTRSKAFCGCSADFGAAPNVNTCPICLALPGALPVLNEHAVELATRAALALGCTVNRVSVFARKNYFYPDLPKGYQISQFDRPLATDGKLVIDVGEGERSIGITRVHMEEDAGKSLHDRYSGQTAIDLNRSGVPLIEIVSEPDMRTSREAGAYLRSLRQILRYLGVSDVSMEEGSLRVDANVSARPAGQKELGTKTEVKNMNSFSGVERALDYEFARQCGMLSRGERVVQQTMLWDAGKAEARVSRTKEGSHDYRYFPEPDLGPLVLHDKWITEIKASLPELPDARKKRYAADYAVSTEEIEQLTVDPVVAEYYELLAREADDPKAAANWMMGEVQAAVNASGKDIESFSVRPADLGQLIRMIRDGLVSHAAAKRVFSLMVETGKPAAQIAHDEALLLVGDESSLSGWVDKVLAEHPEEAKRYLAGERKLQGVLVGFVMRKSGGKADPKRVNQLLMSRAGAG
ncbi:MAG TPA: Asp-tRNA(Asn)/Glu-tRNA(Gln) amidotransferase subunit GatB [Gemmatimonadaceae bacterium]|nr:Asp-tRNA(Asn)/Glu-tRNA(Gln) amidotransferase subunit GatB [Gemmatimonadaceae bacterium]